MGRLHTIELDVILIRKYWSLLVSFLPALQSNPDVYSTCPALLFLLDGPLRLHLEKHAPYGDLYYAVFFRHALFILSTAQIFS
jgi:hypothetical protein